MRIAAFALMLATFASSALADSGKILEPAKKLTTEQQANAIISQAYKHDGWCNQVRRPRGLFPADFTYLVDETGKGSDAEFKFVGFPGGLLQVSQLFKSDHPSKCKGQVFVVDSDTGKLQMGTYGGCDGSSDLRASDSYRFDDEKKRYAGLKHKYKWDIAFRRVMWRTVEIAAKCDVNPLSKILRKT